MCEGLDPLLLALKLQEVGPQPRNVDLLKTLRMTPC